MEHSLAWDANSRIAAQNIICLCFNEMFISVSSRARHRTLSWASWIQFILSGLIIYIIHFNIIFPLTHVHQAVSSFTFSDWDIAYELRVPPLWSLLNLMVLIFFVCRSQWPRGLRRRSAAARLLGSLVQIPLGAWTFVCCVYMLCCPV
jgi:hypothetical protein